MTIKETPNKITAVLKVIATAEFFDDEASEETVRYAIEQDLEDAGFDVDVAILKEQEAVKPLMAITGWACGRCGHLIAKDNERLPDRCDVCGTRVGGLV